MNMVLDYLTEMDIKAELQKIKDKHQKAAEEHPQFHAYVKYWAGEHKAGRDRSGKKAALYGVTKDHTKAYNDSQKAQKKVVKEDAEGGGLPTNIVSGGAIDTKEVPLGSMAKRKEPVEGVTNATATPEDKHLFKQKQDQANQTG